MAKKALQNTGASGPAIKGGYVLLCRRYEQTDLWGLKPIEWRVIWIHIKAHVNFKDNIPNTKLLRGEGLFSFASSKPYLRGISPDQWTRCLKWLRDEKWIETKKTPRGLIIKDLTYELDQNPDSYELGDSTPDVKQADFSLEDPPTPPPDKPKRKTWLTPYDECWQEHMGGDIAVGKARKFLAPLRSKHGDSKVLLHFGNYLGATDPQFVSIARFKETFGSWKENKNGSKANKQNYRKSDSNDPSDYK